MPAGLRKATYAVLFVLLSALAHAPLARAGFLGKDLWVLADTRRPAESRVAPALEGAQAEIQRPVARLSLAVSRRLWSEDGAWSARAPLCLRLENLCLLWLCAGGLALSVRRTLLPWTGSDGAVAAGAASALLLACHPLAVPVVAHPGGRADLIALALCAFATASFLRGRQEREPKLLPVAVLLALLAGFTAPIAWLLPPIAAVLEFASARRHRRVQVRLRTAATTLGVFAAAVAVEALTAAAFGVDRPRSPLAALAAGPDAATRLARCVEKLGLLVLPVPVQTRGATNFVLAGALALLAVQPGLVAARSAPRLWGWILLSFGAALAAVLVPGASVRVAPGEFARAEDLVAGVAIASAGLGIAATAVSGVRRWSVPAAVAVGYALLAHASARAWPAAAAELADLRAALSGARALHGADASFVVIDPPGRTAGLEVLDHALPLVFDPAFADPGPDGIADWVRGIARDAFPAFTRLPDFDRLRAAKLVVLLPAEHGTRARPPALLLAPPEPSTGSTLWRAENRSPLLDLDPFEKRALRVSVLPSASTAEVPRAAWRAREPDYENGECDGAWIESADGPVAIFDLGRSLGWLWGRRIRSLRFRGGPEQIVSAEVLDALPTLALLEERQNGAGWYFRLPKEASPRSIHGGGRYVLGLLETELYFYKEFVAPSGAADELHFPGTQDFLRSTRAVYGTSRSIAWSLEYRVGDVAVARAAGTAEAP